MEDLTTLLLIKDLRERLDAAEFKQGEKGDTGEGEQGPQGVAGANGPAGEQGAGGRDGAAGIDGTDGRDGLDGVGISSVYTDVDGSLVLQMTDGTEHSVDLPQSTGDQHYISRSGGGGIKKEPLEVSIGDGDTVLDYRENSVIVCNNLLPITLTLPPLGAEAQAHTIIRANIGAVEVISIDSTILGETEQMLPSRYDSGTFRTTSLGWFLI